MFSVATYDFLLLMENLTFRSVHTYGYSLIPGQVTCYILVWEDAGVSCTIMGDGSLDELMKVAESIY